ncbi:MAG: SUMF1/EgtB/PvdO family nonheme iron enzyme, partial [Treponema sp.]|nr:SUMF1/EgtB/PvdO family nonheme iron enzyme [Treponema sp.]
VNIKAACLISAAVLAAGLVCGVLSCDGIGTSIKDGGGSLYGGMGGAGTGSGGSGSGSTGSGGGNFTVEDLMNLANAGDVDSILVLLSGTGENQTADGTFTVELSAADIGLPAGGTVTLTITGNGVDYSESAGASADGKVTFEVARIAVGTTVTVTLTVRAADGSIAATGTKTQLVTEGVCDFNVAMVDTAPAPTPAPAPVPAGFVLVAGGAFTSLNPTLAAAGSQTIADFYICSHEVTQEEYETYCSYGSSSPDATYGAGADYPAYYVNWYDALVYCNKRSMAEGLTPCYTISGSTDPADWTGVAETGGKYRGPNSSTTAWNNAACDFDANGYRLPTEAEWEYAARGGPANDPFTYSGSNTVGNVAWYSGNCSESQPVMGLAPNSAGIYDMSGNVWEWCWDKYSSSSSNRVYRGGSWSTSLPTARFPTGTATTRTTGATTEASALSAPRSRRGSAGHPTGQKGRAAARDKPPRSGAKSRQADLPGDIFLQGEALKGRAARLLRASP